MIKNRRIICAGGAGSIGSELVRQLAPNNKIFILDNDESRSFSLSEELKSKGYWVECRVGDITNRETVEDLFTDFRPEIVFNAAARKHVSPMEHYPEEAVRVNVLGNYNLLREAQKNECLLKYIYISTDKAVNPKTVMGATKLLGEIMTRNAGGIAVRFGNVLGSRGSLTEIWQKQHDNGEPLTVTDPQMTRYMMTIEDAVKLVIEASEKGKGGEVFILEMGNKVNILELAKQIVITGKRPGEQITEEIMSEEERLKAKREGEFYVIS
jgi:FlaA1/EpsC-like NDP-sugar epimerase